MSPWLNRRWECDVLDSPRRRPPPRAPPPAARAAESAAIDATFHGEVDLGSGTRDIPYDHVEFAPGRARLLRAAPRLRFAVGDYVLTEGDRGVDVGRVISIKQNPSAGETKGAKLIIRLATQREAQQLPTKTAKERKALEIAKWRQTEIGHRNVMCPLDGSGLESFGGHFVRGESGLW
jgi:hypothetical protein